MYELTGVTSYQSISGFRVGPGGEQRHFWDYTRPFDLAKAMGSGYPISAVVGKRDWMDAKCPVTGCADWPAADGRPPGSRLGDRQNLVVQGLGPMFVTYFGNDGELTDQRDTFHAESKTEPGNG